MSIKITVYMHAGKYCSYNFSARKDKLLRMNATGNKNNKNQKKPNRKKEVVALSHHIQIRAYSRGIKVAF
jgi:hypothetical protein